MYRIGISKQRERATKLFPSLQELLLVAPSLFSKEERSALPSGGFKNTLTFFNFPDYTKREECFGKHRGRVEEEFLLGKQAFSQRSMEVTITIELTPEEEARLEQEAKRRSIEPAEYVRSLVHTALQDRISAYGKYKGIAPTVDEFLEEKQREKAREEARFWR